MDGENTLLFASDYPHWDYDDVSKLHIPPTWRDKVLALNALDVYTRIPRPAAMAAE
jgi:predicted TIM-barrel fold metal-dependent hydrolase